MGFLLGLETLPGCTPFFIKEVFLLQEQAVSYFPSSSGFPTGRNTAVDFLLSLRWLSGYSRMLKFILNFFRGSLTHVYGTSYADSSLRGFFLRSRQQPCCPLLKSLLWLCILQVGA